MKDEAMFVSGLAVELQNYLEYKVASGFQEKSFIKRLKQFDRFCFEQGINDVTYSKENFKAWEKNAPMRQILLIIQE